MNRGEIWWLEHPDAGRRPACILTRQAAIAVLYAVLVAPATRTVRGIPTEVTLDQRDGFEAVCAINCDELVTIDKSRLERRRGALSTARLSELDDALRFALQLR